VFSFRGGGGGGVKVEKTGGVVEGEDRCGDDVVGLLARDR